MNTENSAILVVEDEHFLQLTRAAILKGAGYQVVCTGRGRDAASILEQQPFRLLLLDLNLPDVNGMDLIPGIHRRHPSLQILVLTADGTLESNSESLKRGASDYILKPADPDTILEKVMKALSRKPEG